MYTYYTKWSSTHRSPHGLPFRRQSHELEPKRVARSTTSKFLTMCLFIHSEFYFLMSSSRLVILVALGSGLSFRSISLNAVNCLVSIQSRPWTKILFSESVYTCPFIDLVVVSTSPATFVLHRRRWISCPSKLSKSTTCDMEFGPNSISNTSFP